MNRHAALLFIVAALLMTAACSEPGRLLLPASPSPVATIPRATTGAPATATPISIGQTVKAIVALSDTPCEFSWGPEPCLQFSIVPVTSGLLWVQVSSAGPSELGLRIATEVALYSVGRMEGKALVTAGSTYAVRVSLHNAAGGNVAQSFELTSGVEP